MNDFQKFKEDYLNLKTADETIPPILDFFRKFKWKRKT